MLEIREFAEQTCGKPYLQKRETEDRSDNRKGLGAFVAGGRLFCCWVQGPMLGAATNAGKCLDGDLLLITVHSIYVLYLLNVSLALVYTKAKQVVLPDT